LAFWNCVNNKVKVKARRGEMSGGESHLRWVVSWYRFSSIDWFNKHFQLWN